ncbi:unnamed protein product [Strongylus vulgaris]|uniref:Transthyretin/hydroxyisourate hydrolase domain-containing protein n=1 Tax=Strongylus vulgaris TaxID=40348 RepID=A0A3P7J6C4_STRVU|nr:unnamed protein product [Strongylus vulgaris]
MLFAAFFALALTIAASAHEIIVKGRFACDTRDGEVPVYVELMEKEMLEDQRLNWTITSGKGTFELTGYDDEFYGVRPYMRIMHL